MKKIKGGFLFLLCLALCVFLFCSCSGKKSESFSLGKELKTVRSQVQSKQLHVQEKSRDKLLKIARSDLITLYFDETTFSPAVYDSAGKTLWTALCGEKNDCSAVLSVDVVFEGTKYTLNSQDDCVALSKASFDASDSVLKVSYNLEKQTESGKTFSVCAPVEFCVKSGTLSVSLDAKALLDSRSPSSAVIEKVRLLDFFGSGSSGKKGDFIFVPDGSGLVIDTQAPTKEFKQIAIPVYSQKDLSSENGFANIPAFALKKGNSAFIGVIESGDEISTIYAQKALEKKSPNRVWAEFEITETQQSEKGETLASKKSFDGKIELSFRFLSGENTDYASMAAACRESFIRSGLLSMNEENEKTSTAPFVVNIFGSVQAENGKVKTLTTFEQAREMLTYFRNKGFSDITVNYSGVFDGGLRQNELSVSSLSKKLGSQSDVENLCSFAKAQNIKINLCANLLGANKLGKNAAVSLSGKAQAAERTDISKGPSKIKNSTELANKKGIESACDSLIGLSRKLPFDGICLLDGANCLYGDFSSKNFSSKSQIKQTVSSGCGALSVSGNVATNGANIYALKYSSLILNMPQSAKNASREFCSSIPFLQIVFHGVKPYTLTSPNLCKDIETQALKCVEYGAVLSCDAYYEDFSKDGQSDPMNYLSFGSALQGYYDRFSALSSLSSMKITAHYKVKSGVYCTKFDDSVTVYVNYNKKDARVGGATVEARSFIVLK